MIELQITFRSRRPGSFGASALGRALELVTATWLRFTCLLVSTLIVTLALTCNIPQLILLLLCRFLGVSGQIFANILIIYFFVFSRLIVQEPPKLWLPITRH